MLLTFLSPEIGEPAAGPLTKVLIGAQFSILYDASSSYYSLQELHVY